MRVATVGIVIIVVLIGGIVCLLTATDTISDPASRLTFHNYLTDVGIALGLLGIGHGLDSASRP